MGEFVEGNIQSEGESALPMDPINGRTSDMLMVLGAIVSGLIHLL